jgi:hypothetical protein
LADGPPISRAEQWTLRSCQVKRRATRHAHIFIRILRAFYAAAHIAAGLRKPVTFLRLSVICNCMKKGEFCGQAGGPENKSLRVTRPMAPKQNPALKSGTANIDRSQGEEKFASPPVVRCELTQPTSVPPESWDSIRPAIKTR